jgi:hypothetical protein
MGLAETAATSVTENATWENRIGFGFLERKKVLNRKDWSTDATLRTVCVRRGRGKLGPERRDR